VTAFFGVYLGLHEACRGIALNVLQRFLPEERINEKWIGFGIQSFTIILAWSVVSLNIPILYFTSISSPVFGLVGCLIPAWLVLRIPALSRYRSPALILIILTGLLLLLLVSPLLAFI